MQISQKFEYCLPLKYALKLSLHIKCRGKVSGYAGKNAHDMFLFPKSCTSSNLNILLPFSSHLVAVYSLVVDENLIQCCLHPDKVMKVFCTHLILYRSCRHVSNFASGC